jgi:recombination protein RecT
MVKNTMSENQISAKKTIDKWINSEEFSRRIARTLPKHITPDRMAQVAINALTRTPELRECSPESLFKCLMRLSEIGLEPDGYHAHLIPFGREVQLIVDWKGLAHVIRGAENIGSISTGVIRQGDYWHYEEGSERSFKHSPVFPRSGEVTHAYSFIKFKDGDWEVEVLGKDEVDDVRKRSRAANNGPWVSDYAEMARKTALRRHAKRLRLSPSARDIVTADDDQFDLESKLEVRRAEFKHETKRTELPDAAGSVKAHESAVDRPLQPDTEEVKEDPRAVVAKSIDDGGAPVQSVAEGRTANLAKLNSLIENNGATESEVIGALMHHAVDCGFAQESGEIVNLPEAALQMCVTSWPTVLFTIEKRRRAKK